MHYELEIWLNEVPFKQQGIPDVKKANNTRVRGRPNFDKLKHEGSLENSELYLLSKSP